MDSDQLDERWEAKRHRWEARRHRWESRHSRRGYGSELMGLFIIAIGVLFLLGNLGVIYVQNFWQYWPVILIVLGLSNIARGFYGAVRGLIMAAIGGVFLLRNLGFIHGNVWQFVWPVLLIAVGLGMLVPRAYRRRYWHSRAPWSSAADAAAGTGDNVLNENVVFHHRQRKFDSQNFEGGNIDVVFGGAEIDLRQGATTKEEIVINVHVVFGGLEIWVPESWATTAHGSGVFGGFDNQTHPPNPTDLAKAPRLLVTGDSVFGGVIVRN